MPVAPSHVAADPDAAPSPDPQRNHGSDPTRQFGGARFHRNLWLIVGVALTVRVVWVVLAAHEPDGLNDMSRYLSSARAIAEGEGYVEPITGQPTAYYPPGFPWFVGVIAIVSRPLGLYDDHLPLAIGLAQAVLGAASVLFLGRIGRAL